ncbi:MAG: DUF167 domain-containing protein [candidate division WOR-3 bacterium]|nr:DUF167 domain-containing protein [candidate division WOR-3 bacterium]
MKINVRVIPRARKRDVTKQPDGSYKIKVLSPPINGKANREVREIIAREFGVKLSRVRIISGEKGREKVVEIQGR